VKFLVVGSGAREEAIAWSLAWGRNCGSNQVVSAPGNGASVDPIPVAATDVEGLIAASRDHKVDMVVVGPENALAAGVTDALTAAGFRVFGPTREAAMLESSKGYCREFCDTYGIPGPVWRRFEGPGAVARAREWANEQPFEVVVKADGLMAGKGVVVPADRVERDAAIEALGDSSFLLEERMSGDEVSVLAFCDGTTVSVMPVARDHKRIGEADTGPNTGGMGAYAPTVVCPPDVVADVVRVILQPAVDGMRDRGTPFVGVLYAGVMLTADGPKLIEFNCRFGDPEAEVLLPLLETDLSEVLLACVEGRLDSINVRWSEATSCSVVVAAEGYPVKPVVGALISGVDDLSQERDVQVFFGGVHKTPAGLAVSGGRVLVVTGTGASLFEARQRAYAAASRISFDGMYVRRDIGWRELARTTGGYAAAGVDIDEGNRAVSLIKDRVESTHTPAVLSGVGAFGGVISAAPLVSMAEPVLVATTDGVGTKVLIAAELGRYESVGRDIVNHCVNDLLVQRAKPLFFLDYVASGKLRGETVAELVSGIASACSENGCVVLGGETAEMPGVYHEGCFDVAGTMVGIVERERLLPRTDIVAGDVLIGVASSGLHTNGYSLVRKIFEGLPMSASPAELGCTLGEALMEPHRSYLGVLDALLLTDLVKGLVHVTGGGFHDNIPRVLPANCDATVRTGAWPRGPLFELVAAVSGLSDDHLHRTFNMGIGMIVVVSPDDADAARSLIDEETWVIGEVTPGRGAVRLQ
jgi:phosphoribosylamine--glycine ligase/phosphoribosylaminoimidazole synthetase